MTAKWDISNCNDWKVKDGHEKVIFNLHWNCTDSREYPNPEPEPEPDPGGWTPTLTADGSQNPSRSDLLHILNHHSPQGNPDSVGGLI